MTTLTSENDAALLTRYASSGDADAFTELVHRYVPMLYGTSLRVTRNSADAEDVTQECLLDLAHNASRIRSSIAGYLHATATRRALMLRRGEARRTRRESAVLPPTCDLDPSSASEIVDAVDEALLQLDDASRDLVVRRYLQNQPQESIALALGMHQSTISRRLQSAVETMRDHLVHLGVGGAATSDLARLLAYLPASQPPAGLIGAGAKIGLSGLGKAAAPAALSASAKALFVVVGIGLATIAYVFMGRSGTMPAAAVSLQGTEAERPDLSGIHLSGFGMVRDSVSVSLEAVARVLGRDADYERLYTLSGNAFVPAIDTSESCRSWWHVQARLGTKSLPAMASAIGLEARQLALAAIPSDATDHQKDAARMAAGQVARQEMDLGGIILTEGGWDELGGWVWAGVVTQVEADGSMRGAAMSAATGDGKENVVWKYPGSLWGVRSASESLEPAAAERVILATAVARIRGTGDYANSGPDRFGLAAMDEWIATMYGMRGFCADCFVREPVVGVQDAPDNDKRLHASALIVARQLRAMKTVPESAKPHLEQAAACYDTIAALLAPGATGTDGFTWDSLNSLDAQRKYVRDVLQPVRNELEWAAAHVERALAMVDGAKLNAALLPHYDQLTRESPDMNAIRTNHLARVIAARSMQRNDITYDDLLMIDGSATGFAYHPNKYFLMYQPMDGPAEEASRVVEGSGLAWEMAEFKTADSAWPMVKQCVDSSTPLVCTWMDDFFIAGYQDAPNVEDRRIYTMGKWSIGEWMRWSEFGEYCASFGRYGRPAGNIPQVDLTRSILERIVERASHDRRADVPFMSEGRFGFNGMEAYAADVADMTKGPEYFDAAWLACHAINRQWHGRESAGRWLLRHATAQTGPAAEQLHHAGELYLQSNERWLEFRKLLSPGPGEVLEERWKDATARARGASLVRDAIKLEREAVAHISAALTAIR